MYAVTYIRANRVHLNSVKRRALVSLSLSVSVIIIAHFITFYYDLVGVSINRNDRECIEHTTYTYVRTRSFIRQV